MVWKLGAQKSYYRSVHVVHSATTIRITKMIYDIIPDDSAIFSDDLRWLTGQVLPRAGSLR
jgi:hypothetical protein